MNSKSLPACCLDMDIRVLELLLPESFMDARGLEFYRAHGLDQIVKKNEVIEFRLDDEVIRIPILALFFPKTFLDAAGLGFYYAHHLDDLVDNNAMIKLLHRCVLLQDDGRCSVYDTDKFPQICRDFDCSTRFDCTCRGQGFIPIESMMVTVDQDD